MLTWRKDTTLERGHRTRQSRQIRLLRPNPYRRFLRHL